MYRSFTSLVATFIAGFCGSALAAQQEDQPGPAGNRLQPAAPLPVASQPTPQSLPTTSTSPLGNPGSSPWRIPVHTNAADPEGGEYGIWAAGADYKASFHDGFTFYPVLGTAWPHNLPLHWRTEAVTAGGEAMVAAFEPKPAWSDWRIEYRHDKVTEAYDVVEQGVEQTFVLLQAPPRAGDVVVTGRITTALEARPVASRHGGIAFFDGQGVEILSYGEAYAFDAAGRRTEVATSFDGARIELTLSGAWLDGATYPVTIDPLVGTTVISTWGGGADGQPSYPDVCRDDENNKLWTSYSRAAAGSDYDTFVRRTEDDFSGTTLLYSDVTATWSTRYNQITYIAGSDRIAVALGRENLPGAGIRVYLHDDTNTTLNSGTTLFVPRPAGTQDLEPSIGGTFGFSSGNTAFVAYREDTGSGSPNTINSEVWGVLVNGGLAGGAAPTLGGTVELETTLTDYDGEWPCVSQVANGGDSWIVVWQSYNNTITGDDWDIIGQRVRADGTLAGRDFFGPASATTHKVRPKVSGLNDRYLVAYTEFTNDGTRTVSPWGTEINAHRFNWTETSSTATKLAIGDVAVSASSTLTTGSGSRGIAHNDDTTSHWLVAWHTASWNVFAARLGYDAGIAETVTVYNTADFGFSPSACYNNDTCEFDVVWGTNENPPTGQPVYGARVTYRASAHPVYGASCAGSILGDNRGVLCNEPHLGSEFYTVSLTGGRANAVTFLLASFGQANLLLPSAGSPTCRVLIAPPASDASGLLISSAAGNAAVTFRIPSEIGDLNYLWQWFQFDANAIWSSDGLRTNIR